MAGLAPDQLTQAINPWNWWLKTSDNVTGFINITQYKSENHETEQKIIQEVAGYGMQLDMIEQMIAVLSQHLPKQKLSREQKQTLAEFEKMLSDINAKKEQVILEQLSTGGVNKLIDNLAVLKEKFPKRYEIVAQKLREAL